MGLTPENHQVVGEDAQTDFADLAVMVTGSDSRTHVAFEHAEDGFDLPTLAVGAFREVTFHESSVVAGDGLATAIVSRSASVRCRDDATDTERLTAEPVESFRFVPGVGDQSCERLLTQRSEQRRVSFDVIEPGSAVDYHAKHEMAGRIANGRKLRISKPIVA